MQWNLVIRDVLKQIEVDRSMGDRLAKEKETVHFSKLLEIEKK